MLVNAFGNPAIAIEERPDHRPLIISAVAAKRPCPINRPVRIGPVIIGWCVAGPVLRGGGGRERGRGNGDTHSQRRDNKLRSHDVVSSTRLRNKLAVAASVPRYCGCL